MNQNYQREKKKHWHNHFDNRNDSDNDILTVQSTYIKLPGPTKFVLIMRCSNYEFVLNINCKYNELSRNHNQLSELTGFLD